MTPHIEAKKGEIAKTVLMPGDPLRAKYIAENYLEDYKLVNEVRNMLAYTGTYKGKEVTVMGSGMGMASIGIYSYELFKFYDVEKIIRIGTCGSGDKDVKILDVVLAKEAYSLTYLAKLFNDDDMDTIPASNTLNQKILKTAEEQGTNVKYGQVITTDVFNPYADFDKFMKQMPSNKYLAFEMEAYSLFYMANFLNKEAACLLTVSDSIYDDTVVTAKDRETALDKMITLALEVV